MEKKSNELGILLLVYTIIVSICFVVACFLAYTYRTNENILARALEDQAIYIDKLRNTNEILERERDSACSIEPLPPMVINMKEGWELETIDTLSMIFSSEQEYDYIRASYIKFIKDKDE